MNRIFWIDPKNGMSEKVLFHCSILRSRHSPRTSPTPPCDFPQDVIASVLRGQYSPLSRPMEPGGFGWRWAWSDHGVPYINGWIYSKWAFPAFFFVTPIYGALLSNMVFGHTLLGCCFVFFSDFMGKSKVYVYIPKEIVPSLTTPPVPKGLDGCCLWGRFPGILNSLSYGSRGIELHASWWNPVLAEGFKYFLFSSRSLGKWSNLTNIFQIGWNHQLVLFA